MGTRPYKLFGNPETMNMNPLLINNIKVRRAQCSCMPSCMV